MPVHGQAQEHRADRLALLLGRAGDDAAVESVLAEEEHRLRGILGRYVFGVDDDTMESVVLDMLRRRGLSLAVAESVTGGIVGSRLTAIPGASDVFRGGIVSYASEVKFSVLGVPEGPVVSADAARVMAEGERRVLGADVALATTGVAGPSEQEGQPVGTVFLGLAMGEASEAQRVQLPGDRQRIRQYAVISAVNLLRRRLMRA